MTRIFGSGQPLWAWRSQISGRSTGNFERTFADRMAFALIKKSQDIEDEQAKKHVEQLKKDEMDMNGTYKFHQFDIQYDIKPQGEHKESQDRCGIFKKYHTKIYLKGKLDVPEMTTRSKGEFCKVAMQARCLWCSRVHYEDHRTTLCCVECGVGFCAPTSGRNCWAQHVRNNGLPPRKKAQKL